MCCIPAHAKVSGSCIFTARVKNSSSCIVTKSKHLFQVDEGEIVDLYATGLHM